jgi:hypothetical protein
MADLMSDRQVAALLSRVRGSYVASDDVARARKRQDLKKTEGHHPTGMVVKNRGKKRVTGEQVSGDLNA